MQLQARGGGLVSIEWVWLTYKFMCIVQLKGGGGGGGTPAYGPAVHNHLAEL